MRTLTVDLFSTVDGFAKGSRSPGYFGYGGPELDAWIHEQVAAAHVMLMGATTYRVLSGIVAPDDDPAAARMDEVPKLVVSRSLVEPLTWPNSTLVPGDPAETVPALKNGPGNPLRVIGSLTLVRSLLVLGLVDRLRLILFPQILGETG